MYIFGRPFLGHHYYIPSLYGPCPGVEKKIFLRNASILNFLHQNYLPVGKGGMKFTISCLLTLQMLDTKSGQDWPSSS